MKLHILTLADFGTFSMSLVYFRAKNSALCLRRKYGHPHFMDG